jgi:short-subunit dehydrogenase
MSSNGHDAERAWAVVTGASSGLGREFALELAQRGQPVLAAARREDRLRLLADEVRTGGGRLEPLIADLSTREGVDALLTRASSLDVGLLVNNAGLATYGAFASLSGERELELIQLNVEAVVALTHGLLPAMIERRRGGIINVASQMAFQPMPYFATYAASKAFVLSFSEALAEELRAQVCESLPWPQGLSTQSSLPWRGAASRSAGFRTYSRQRSSRPRCTHTIAVRPSRSSAASMRF